MEGRQVLHQGQKTEGKTEVSEDIKRKIHNFVENDRGGRNWITTGRIPGSHQMYSSLKPVFSGYGVSEFTHVERSSKELFHHQYVFPESGVGNGQPKNKNYLLSKFK